MVRQIQGEQIPGHRQSMAHSLQLKHTRHENMGKRADLKQYKGDGDSNRAEGKEVDRDAAQHKHDIPQVASSQGQRPSHAFHRALFLSMACLHTAPSFIVRLRRAQFQSVAHLTPRITRYLPYRVVSGKGYKKLRKLVCNLSMPANDFSITGGLQRSQRVGRRCRAITPLHMV